MTVMVSSSEAPVRVNGVHGGRGDMYWKCFVRLHMLQTDVVAFEFLRLDPGGVIGDHVHSRSEEIYYILSGRGQMRVDGETREVTGGDLIVAPQGTRHGLVGLGSKPVEILVIEALPPAVQAVLPDYVPSA
jgi:mannose-6-phosphate isomerase-like protein (cupin superfamily)